MSNIGRPVINKHEVPAKVWSKWSNERKSLYNQIMHELRPSRQTSFIPLCTPMMKRSEWYLMTTDIADVLSEKLS